MGCVMSAEEKAQQQMSRRIDDELAHEMAHKRNEVKLLLLGKFNEERHAIARKEREREGRGGRLASGVSNHPRSTGKLCKVLQASSAQTAASKRCRLY